MIKVLTETEYKFLKEFIALIEKYNLLFTTDEKGEIEVTVHRQQKQIRIQIYYILPYT